MDRTAIFVLVLCMLAFFGWFFMMNKLYPPRPVTSSATNTLTSLQNTNPPPSISTSTVTSGTGAPPSSGSVALANAPAPLADTNIAEQFLVLTNDNARYTFTSHGGGLKLVE